jgi:hypothetical protein
VDANRQRLRWIGVLVAGAVLAGCYFLPTAWLMTGDGWTAKPFEVHAFAGPYLFGAISAVAALALLFGKPRLRSVLLWVAIFVSLIAALSVLALENLLLVDCLEHDGRSPDLTRATTGRVLAVLAVAWPSFILMVALIARTTLPAARFARALTLAGAVFVTWFACLSMAAEVEYGLWISLLASMALTACGFLSWRAEQPPAA